MMSAPRSDDFRLNEGAYQDAVKPGKVSLPNQLNGLRSEAQLVKISSVKAAAGANAFTPGLGVQAS